MPQTFTADDGTIAVPALNNLNLLSRDVTDNNDNGVQTTVDPNGGDDFFVELTNRATGQTSTTDDTLTAIITFPMGTAKVVSMTGYVSARITSGGDVGDGASYFFDAAFKTDGAAATEIGTEYPTTFEDPSLATADIFVTASGNNVVLQVKGPLATNVNWDAFLEFRQVV